MQSQGPYKEMVGRVGVEPTTLKRTVLQTAAFADSLPTQMGVLQQSAVNGELTVFSLIRRQLPGHPAGCRSPFFGVKGRGPSQRRRQGDKMCRILPYLRGSCDFNRHNRPWEYPQPSWWTRPMGSEPIVKLLFPVAEPAQ